MVRFYGDLLQEDLCHTQVCFNQIPCPCGRPPPICTYTGDAQTQVSRSYCAQGLFEPSECLWWECGLILNMNSPLLLSFWDFSFVRGHGVSSPSHSSAYHLTGLTLTLNVGYLHMASPVKCSHCSWPWTLGISSPLLKQKLDSTPDLERGLSPLAAPGPRSLHSPVPHPPTIKKWQ